MTREVRQCSFCGEPVRTNADEPVEITVTFKDKSSQVFWAHIDCIGIRLHKSVPWLSLRVREETPE